MSDDILREFLNKAGKTEEPPATEKKDASIQLEQPASPATSEVLRGTPEPGPQTVAVTAEQLSELSKAAAALERSNQPMRLSTFDRGMIVVAAVGLIVTVVVLLFFGGGGGDSPYSPRPGDVDQGKYEYVAEDIEGSLKELVMTLASHHKETSELLRNPSESEAKQLKTMEDLIKRDKAVTKTAWDRFFNTLAELELENMPSEANSPVGEEHADYTRAVSEGFMRVVRDVK